MPGNQNRVASDLIDRGCWEYRKWHQVKVVQRAAGQEAGGLLLSYRTGEIKCSYEASSNLPICILSSKEVTLQST